MLLQLVTLLAIVQISNARYLLYLTGQHNIIPERTLVSEITHVALAFMRSSVFNSRDVPVGWPLFTSVEEVRSRFSEGTKVMVAIGGWGDTEGFEEAARTEEGRKSFARNVRAMVESTGADGVDIDWEYPGGNGEDYKQIPNAEKRWQVEAYPQLLSSIRSALGSTKIISAAVPGLPRDMLAFSATTMPSIDRSVDFLNIMTYDLMNRRDTRTKHHTGMQASLKAITSYLSNGLPASKANLGFAFYIKWFRTSAHENCNGTGGSSIGCKTALMEDPVTGADLGRSGAFSWHDAIPSELSVSFAKALRHGQYDEVGGGHCFWDETERIWWSWETELGIRRKFPGVVREWGLGGVFAWGLGEDAPDWVHLRTLTDSYRGEGEGEGARVADEL